MQIDSPDCGLWGRSCKKEPVLKEPQAIAPIIYQFQKVIIEIPKAIQKIEIPIYNKDKYRNFKKINKPIKLYIEFSKSNLKNIPFFNITKSKEFIKQKQILNLLKTIG